MPPSSKEILHLTIELLEFGKPLMIGLNMIDVAKSRGIEINIKNLSNKLGVAIQPIIARTGKGCNQLLEKLLTRKITSRTFSTGLRGNN